MAERLTFEGNFCDIAMCRENRWGKHCPDGACSQRKVWERLKQYEDSDAVPVVRCKDCEKDGISTCPLCFIENRTLQFINHDQNFYCGYGERRTDEQ